MGTSDDGIWDRRTKPSVSLRPDCVPGPAGGRRGSLGAQQKEKEHTRPDKVKGKTRELRVSSLGADGPCTLLWLLCSVLGLITDHQIHKPTAGTSVRGPAGFI